MTGETESKLPQGRDVSVPLQEIVMQATGLSLLLMVVPALVFGLLWGFGTLFSDFRPLLFVAFLVLFTLAHEGFHAVGWKYWGEIRWQDIEFGFKWEALAPYTHATAPMKADAYRLGAALPGIMTGLLPYMLALLTGNGMMALLTSVMISGAVGDIYVLYIMRDVAPDAMVVDHPDNAGCIVVKEGTTHQ